MEFEIIKVAIVSSPMLVSLYFYKHFGLYSLAYEDTIVEMLTCKNQKE